MIIDERIQGYMDSLDTGNADYLNRIEREALLTHVPVIKAETQRFLKLILAIKKPEQILEIGTAVGFSALFMEHYNPVCCNITTIENYEKRIPVARENFKAAGKEKEILLLEGDAGSILPTLNETFDFIFLDAAKGQYVYFLPELLRLLRGGGILVTDNVLQDGDVVESRFAVTRRNRTIHKRMRQYLYEVTHNDALISAVLPIGDGLAVSTKKE